jgi:hypothetical protein
VVSPENVESEVLVVKLVSVERPESPGCLASVAKTVSLAPLVAMASLGRWGLLGLKAPWDRLVPKESPVYLVRRENPGRGPTA